MLNDRMADNGASLGYGTTICMGALTRSSRTPHQGVLESYSVAAGLDYPGVGPELAFLAEIGRVLPRLADDGPL